MVLGGGADRTELVPVAGFAATGVLLGVDGFDALFVGGGVGALPLDLSAIARFPPIPLPPTARPCPHPAHPPAAANRPQSNRHNHRYNSNR